MATTGLTLHCCPQEERPAYHRHKKGSSVGGLCYLSMGVVVLFMGLVFASVYIYRYFFLAQVRWGGGRRRAGQGEGLPWVWAGRIRPCERRRRGGDSRKPWTRPLGGRGARTSPEDLPPSPLWSWSGRQDRVPVL